MSLLTVIISTAAILFIIIGWDAYKRGKINLLHGVIFIGGWIIVWYSLWNPNFLNDLGDVFGIARGADILVYGSILVLGYFYFELLHKHTKDGYSLTKLVTNEALSHVDSDYIVHQAKQIQQSTNNHWSINKSQFMFHVKWLNESKTIGKVIDDIVQAWFSKILVVNDGSTDEMSTIVKHKQQEHPDILIVLLNHLINRKHGWGNKTWIAFFRSFGELCRINYVVFFDADGQMDIADMDRSFLPYLTTHPEVDVIQWSRFVPGGEATDIPLMRKIVLWWAKLVTYIFNGIAITDPHNGYKCFKLNALQKISLTSDSTIYANELIDEYRRLWLKVVELPVHIRYSDYSLWKGQKNSNARNILFELIYKKLFFR